jgi:hypothetical protein
MDSIGVPHRIIFSVPATYLYITAMITFNPTQFKDVLFFTVQTFAIASYMVDPVTA